MTRRNADNAQAAEKIAGAVRLAATEGAAGMTEMDQAMQAVKASSDNIGKIIKTIDEIAFQTNIPALNAAVEAARAGEAGMGFAVVADEVRNLAQRSARAARETAEKIEDSIRKSGNGVEISVKVTARLSEIVEKARQVDSLVGEIARASREQSQGISQVSTAVLQMGQVTQSNAATAEESASAATELHSQSSALQTAVRELLSQVIGEAAGNTARAPVAPSTSVPRATARPKASITGTHHRVVEPKVAPKASAEAPARGSLTPTAEAEWKDF
jgi:methyl-accepting chemotaxis protein